MQPVGFKDSLFILEIIAALCLTTLFSLVDKTI
jgi:hypothetical protein